MSAGATFGIDLASQPSRTASCLIDWDQQGCGVVRCPENGRTDAQLLARMTEVEYVTHVAIDAPFGWPSHFIDVITSYRDTGTWQVDGEGSSLELRLRVTDLAVHDRTGLWPLSVSTDRIGIVAMRCARLLSATHETLGEPIDRSGHQRLLEVYPAAALKCWGISPKHSIDDPGSYKGPSPQARARRMRLVDEIVNATSPWLEISEKTRVVCTDSDDCLDALICALVARAAQRELLEPIPDEELQNARLDGWIRLPRPASLSLLGVS